MCRIEVESGDGRFFSAGLIYIAELDIDMVAQKSAYCNAVIIVRHCRCH